jgi:hypothetical protein
MVSQDGGDGCRSCSDKLVGQHKVLE